MNRFEKAAYFGHMMGKLAADPAAKPVDLDNPNIRNFNNEAWRADPNNEMRNIYSKTNYDYHMNPERHGRAHPSPMVDGPSWVNGQVDRRIPFWNQKNVVESAPAVAHRGAMYPSPVQNQQNLANTTTQYGSFPRK
jgi:hypothetical protein